MRALAWKAIAAAAVLAAVLVPAASAKSSPRVKLSVLPLPKPALGSAAHGLAIAHDGGVISNSALADRSFTGATPGTFKKMGRVTGYALDYGNQASGAQGVASVWTSVDEYKKAAGAKKGLAFWKKDDLAIGQRNTPDFAVQDALVKVPSVGRARFGDLTSFGASNIAPLSTFDENVVEGRYLLDVTVSAGTAGEAQKLGTQYAKKLDQRVRLALAGKLHARPVKLPGKVKPGPPPGGPNLSAMALATSDLTGQATLIGEDYFTDFSAVSHYSLLMLPAGQFDLLDQEIAWYANANEAAFFADWNNALLVSGGGNPVDLSSVGHGARGAIESDPEFGDFGQAVLSVGKLTDTIVVVSQTVQDSDLLNVAQIAANKIDATLGP